MCSMSKNPMQNHIKFGITINDYNNYLLNMTIIYVYELQTIFFTLHYLQNQFDFDMSTLWIFMMENFQVFFHI